MWSGYFFAIWGIVWKVYPGYPDIGPAVRGRWLDRVSNGQVAHSGQRTGFTIIERTLIIVALGFGVLVCSPDGCSSKAVSPNCSSKTSNGFPAL